MESRVNNNYKLREGEVHLPGCNSSGCLGCGGAFAPLYLKDPILVELETLGDRLAALEAKVSSIERTLFVSETKNSS